MLSCRDLEQPLGKAQRHHRQHSRYCTPRHYSSLYMSGFNFIPALQFSSSFSSGCQPSINNISTKFPNDIIIIISSLFSASLVVEASFKFRGVSHRPQIGLRSIGLWSSGLGPPERQALHNKSSLRRDPAFQT